MLKKVVATILIVTCSVLCLPVFSSAAIYDIVVTMGNATLIYTSPSRVDGVDYEFSEEVILEGDSYYFNSETIDFVNSSGLASCTTISQSIIVIDFPTADFVAGQSYNISFDISSGVYGNYAALSFPNYEGLVFCAFEILDFYNYNFVNSNVPSWNDTKNIFSCFIDENSPYILQPNYETSLFTSSNISMNIKIPVDYVIPDDPSSVSLCLLWRSVNPQYMKISNFSITPLGTTKYLFEEHDFRVQVQDDLGDIKDSLLGEGETFEPAISNKAEFDEALSNEAALNKDFSDDLSSNLSGSTNIFDTNGAFFWITNTFNNLFIDDLSLGFVNPFNTLILFSLAVGLCVLILGRRLNA